MRTALSILLGLAGAAFVGRADSPPPPPSKYIQRSLDGSITALADPQTNQIEFHKTNTGEILWRHPQWEPWIFVANDGLHVVIGYPGMNLIYGYDPDLVLFTFWRRGQKLRDVTLRELMPNQSVLQKTASHYFWGIIETIDAEGRLVVRRADNWVFLYEVTSGKQFGEGKYSPRVYSPSPPRSERAKRFKSYSVTTVAFAEPGLCRVSFWGSYTKSDKAIEIKFDGKGNAVVDGDPVEASKLTDELYVRQLLSTQRQLSVVGDDFSEIDQLLEKVAMLRRLDFDEITITTDYVWQYEPSTKRWSRREFELP